MNAKAAVLLSLALVAVGFLMATPFHAIGVAVGGDRGGEIGMTVWKMAMVLGGVAHLSYLTRSRGASRGLERSDDPGSESIDGLALAEQEDI